LAIESRRVRAALSYLLVAPATFLFTVFFIFPILALLAEGFYSTATLQAPSHLSLENYLTFFSKSAYLNVLAATMRIAVISTSVVMVISYPLAYLIAKSENELLVKSSLILIFLSFFVGGVVRNYAWLVMFLPEGLITSLLSHLGLANVRLLNTELGIIIGLTHFLIPFATLALVPSIRNIDPFLLEAATSLGATRTQAFVRITLPLSVPGIIAAVTLSFSLGVSAFVTPLILGGGIVNMLSNLIYIRFAEIFDYPFGAMLSAIMLVTALAISSGLNVLLMKRVEGVYK